MQQAVFESLTGRFLDETPLENTGHRERRVFSIMDHLSRLFNTRLGSISHIPDYGLPDISEIYRDMPHGLERLQKAIKEAVAKYEPRLINAKIHYLEAEADMSRLTFVISGEISGSGPVRFRTSFTGNRSPLISPLRNRSGEQDER